MEDLEDFVALRAAYGPEEAQARIDEYLDACAPGRAEAERLLSLPPGPELNAGLEAIKQMLLDRATKVLVRTCWQRQLSYTHAQSLAATSDAAGTPSTDLSRKTIPDIARHARQSENAVGMELAQGWHMRDALRQTWEALNVGDIRPAHARMLHQVTYRVDDAITRQVEEKLLPKAIAGRWTPAKLADAARMEVRRLDPEGARKRAEAAKRGADVTMRPDEDEMAVINAYGDAFTTRQMMDEINRRAEAKQRAGDDRSVGERRTGALAEALLGEDTTLDAQDIQRMPAEATTPTGKRPSKTAVHLLVTLSTLLGGSGPARLDGFGPITDELARKIAAKDAVFRRLVFDPMGRPQDLSTDSYAATPEMRRWLEARDRSCIFPGCMCRAIWCDNDHGIDYPEGETSCKNCGLLCRKHHNLKTRKWWKLRRDEDLNVEWTSPLGFVWRQPPNTYEEFLDNPDPPEIWDPDEDEPISSVPDPPRGVEEIPWPDQPPPVDDEEYDYDEMARYYAYVRKLVLAS